MESAGYQREHIPKLLKIINNRANVNAQHKRQSQDWPTSHSFTLLNKTYTRNSTRASTPSASARKITNFSQTKQNSDSRPQTVNTLSLMCFSRPLTCGGRRTVAPKKKTQASSINLFNFAKQQKLARLQEEKESLMTTLYNQQKPVIHRIDEGQEEFDKPNAINFKAYHFMNRLMDIKEQIYQTSNYRPKTSQPLRKTKVNRTVFS